MCALNSEEIATLEGVLGSDHQLLSSAVARVYNAVDGEWVYTLQFGAACLACDTATRSCTLHVVDLDSREILLTHDVVPGFEYKEARPFFHCFSVSSDPGAAISGLSFADPADAHQFARAVALASSVAVPALGNAQSRKAHGSQNRKAPSKRLSMLVGTLKSKISNAFKSEEEKLEISVPTDFRHESHAGWNPEKDDFEIENVPREWKELFKAAGVTKRQLKNPETRKAVMQVVRKATMARLHATQQQQHAPQPKASPRGTAAPTLPPRGVAAPPPPRVPAPVVKASRNLPHPPPSRRPMSVCVSASEVRRARQEEEDQEAAETEQQQYQAEQYQEPEPEHQEYQGQDEGQEQYYQEQSQEPVEDQEEQQSGDDGSGRNSFLSQVQKGVKLRKVEARDVKPPSVHTTEGQGIVGALQQAMIARRGQLREEETTPDEGAEEDDWSD